MRMINVSYTHIKNSEGKSTKRIEGRQGKLLIKYLSLIALLMSMKERTITCYIVSNYWKLCSNL